MQVEGPRFCKNITAHDGGSIHVVGVFRPEFLAVCRIQHQQFAFVEFASQKLFPIVPVGIGTAQDHVFVGVHQGQAASTSTDVCCVSDVDGILPQLFTSLAVQRNGLSDVEFFHLGFGFLCRVARECLQLSFVLKIQLLSFFRCDRTVDEVRSFRTNGDRSVQDVVAAVCPHAFARFYVDREDSIRLTLHGQASPPHPRFQFFANGAGSKQLPVIVSQIGPGSFDAIRRFRRFVRGHDFARGGIECGTRIFNGHIQSIIAGGKVVRFAIVEDSCANRARVLVLPQERAVICVIRHDAVGALNEHPSVSRKRCAGGFVSVDHRTWSGIAVPQYSQTFLDALIVCKGRVGRVAVLV